MITRETPWKGLQPTQKLNKPGGKVDFDTNENTKMAAN